AACDLLKLLKRKTGSRSCALRDRRASNELAQQRQRLVGYVANDAVPAVLELAVGQQAGGDGRCEIALALDRKHRGKHAAAHERRASQLMQVLKDVEAAALATRPVEPCRDFAVEDRSLDDVRVLRNTGVKREGLLQPGPQHLGARVATDEPAPGEVTD